MVWRRTGHAVEFDHNNEDQVAPEGIRNRAFSKENLAES